MIEAAAATAVEVFAAIFHEAWEASDEMIANYYENKAERYAEAGSSAHYSGILRPVRMGARGRAGHEGATGRVRGRGRARSVQPGCAGHAGSGRGRRRAPLLMGAPTEVTVKFLHYVDSENDTPGWYRVYARDGEADQCFGPYGSEAEARGPVAPHDDAGYWTPDEAAEALEGVSPETSARLWALMDGMAEVKPLGGDGSDGTVEWPEPTEDRHSLLGIWSGLTDAERDEINAALTNEATR